MTPDISLVDYSPDRLRREVNNMSPTTRKKFGEMTETSLMMVHFLKSRKRSYIRNSDNIKPFEKSELRQDFY